MIDKAVRQLRQAWGPLDPARDGAGVPGARARADGLRKILATAPSEQRGTVLVPVFRRRVLMAAGGLTAAAVACGVAVAVWNPARPAAYAATPAPLAYEPPAGPVRAEPRLAQLAVAAERDSATAGHDPTAADPGVPAGTRVEHLRIASWDLHTEVDGQRVTSAVVAVQRESWRARDDSGRITRRYLEPVFDSDRARQAWRDAGSPGAGTGPQTTVYPPGRFPAIWSDRPPADTAGLTRWLQHHHPAGAGPAAAGAAIVDLLRERVLTGAERAAVLRVLARLPGVEFTGAVRDRAGRRGEAFSVVSAHTGLPTRYTFIVQPATGRFLAFELMLTTTAGRLDVTVPAVIGYDTYLTAERAAAPQ